MRFKDKSIFITGAARGIGKTFAEAFTKEGGKVIIADIDFDQAQQTAKEVGQNSLAVHMDVTKQSSIEEASSILDLSLIHI